MSNADSRTPSTDALDTLGMIHWKPEKRDAIHLAVEAVKASRALIPGQRIGIVEGVAYPEGFVLMGVFACIHLSLNDLKGIDRHGISTSIYAPAAAVFG